MTFISAFNVLGPEMIGPSSSHTAGACSIALLAQQMADSPVKDVEFVLYNSFAQTYKGHGTCLLYTSPSNTFTVFIFLHFFFINIPQLPF